MSKPEEQQERPANMNKRPEPPEKQTKRNTFASRKSGKAVALKYDQSSGAPIVIASGMGYTAERMVEIAEDNGVPIYEDNSLATMLSQLQLGQPIPAELYQAIVQIYVYFLNFDAKDPNKAQREREEAKRLQQEQAAKAKADVVETSRSGGTVPQSLEDQMASLYNQD